jgi:hypothetical protein
VDVQLFVDADSVAADGVYADVHPPAICSNNRIGNLTPSPVTCSSDDFATDVSSETGSPRREHIYAPGPTPKVERWVKTRISFSFGPGNDSKRLAIIFVF